MIKLKVLNTLLCFFFIFGFFSFTYATNVYVLFSLVFVPYLLVNRMNRITQLFVLLFLFLFVLQLFYHGVVDAYRIYKTFIVLLPFFLYSNLKQNNEFFPKALKYFMYINALFLYVDFILYFTIGTTIIPTKNSGFMPRLGALTEDSNFYSYLMLAYVFLNYVKESKISYFCFISIFLSGSFSAISVSIILLCYFRKTTHTNWFKRNLITLFTVLVFVLYSIILYNAHFIIENIESWNVHELLKIKIISMSHRFLAQSESLINFLNYYNWFWGAGAGKTIELNSLGINMHNTYFQLLLESGLICFLSVLAIIIYMGKKIEHTKIYLLYCSVFLLGLMMEVVYFPLLSFIYFYGQSQVRKEKISICNNIY